MSAAPKADHDLAWRLFASCVSARLEVGARESGDRSFSRAPAELVAEMQAEALDVAGWGFILWCRLQRMREQLEELETRPANDVGGDAA